MATAARSPPTSASGTSGPRRASSSPGPSSARSPGRSSSGHLRRPRRRQRLPHRRAARRPTSKSRRRSASWARRSRLLMIAGEFDLSVGSMVGAAGMIVAIGIGEFGWPVWLAVRGRLRLRPCRRLHQRLHRGPHPAALLHRHAGHAVHPARRDDRRDTHDHRADPGRRPQGADRRRPVVGDLHHQLRPIRVGILWWIGLALRRDLRPSADQLRQLDLRLRRLGDRGPQRRCSGRARQDPPLHGHRGIGRPARRDPGVHFGSGDVLRGEQKEFEAIITAVIGGTLLTGGYGSAIGAVFGALTLGITKQGIFFAGIGSDWYQAFLGLLLLTAVLVNNWVRTRAAQVRH